VSYGFGTRKLSQTRGLLRYLRRHKHTTPSEMVELKFHCSHAHLRCAPVDSPSHRQRQRDVGAVQPDAHAVLPAARRTAARAKRAEPSGQRRRLLVCERLRAEAFQRWQALRADAVATYEWLNGHEVAREIARIDLPLSTYTQWYWKIDLHNLLHFLTLRVDSHAQWEIQEFGRVMAGMLKRVAPLSYEAWIDYDVCGAHLSRMELDVLRSLVRGATAGSRRIPPPVPRRHGSQRTLAPRDRRTARRPRPERRSRLRTRSVASQTSFEYFEQKPQPPPCPAARRNCRKRVHSAG
jgi:thymidylate synthase (FAD)